MCKFLNWHNAPLIHAHDFFYFTFLFAFALNYLFVEEGPLAITVAKRQLGASDFYPHPFRINNAASIRQQAPLTAVYSVDVDKLRKTSSNSLCISWKEINMKLRHDKWGRLLAWKWAPFIIGVLGEETDRRSRSFCFIWPWPLLPWLISILTAYSLLIQGCMHGLMNEALWEKLSTEMMIFERVQLPPPAFQWLAFSMTLIKKTLS